MIDSFIEKYNLPKYRKEQFLNAFFKESITSWDNLTTWPTTLRDTLKKEIPFITIHNHTEIWSKDRRTTKLLSYTEDGYPIETVLMRTEKRNTVCVSCMSGCPVGCKFCATGKMGFNKLLTSQEILDQVMYFKRILKKESRELSNVVFMGMGEPLLNLNSVVEAIKIITNPAMLGISHRRITLSTAGYVKELEKLLNLNLGIRIAISLHAPNQKLREEIMPTVARTNSLNDLLLVLKKFQLRTNKRVTYEYLLLRDINDTYAHAKELGKLLKNQICLVNLINFNESQDIDFKPSRKKDVEIFRNTLNSFGITNTVRYSFGGEISAACGQLANKSG
jgi:23S rRNA (adenine2503-C2)-methyltransferase